MLDVILIKIRLGLKQWSIGQRKCLLHS